MKPMLTHKNAEFLLTEVGDDTVSMATHIIGLCDHFGQTT